MPLQEPITPQELVKPATVLSVDTVVFRFGTDDQYAYAACSFLDEDGKVVRAESVGLTANELNSWGSDDAVLISIIKAKLSSVTSQV